MLPIAFPSWSRPPAPPLSQMQKAQKYTVQFIRAQEYPVVARVAIRAIGYFSLVVITIATLGFSLDFTYRVWEEISQKDALQNIARIVSGNRDITLESVPSGTFFRSPPFSKVNENHFRFYIKNRWSGIPKSVDFKLLNDKIECTAPEFMDGSIPNDELVEKMFAPNAQTDRSLTNIGCKGDQLKAKIVAIKALLIFDETISFCFDYAGPIIWYAITSYPVCAIALYYLRNEIIDLYNKSWSSLNLAHGQRNECMKLYQRQSIAQVNYEHLKTMCKSQPSD